MKVRELIEMEFINDETTVNIFDGPLASHTCGKWLEDCILRFLSSDMKSFAVDFNDNRVDIFTV